MTALALMLGLPVGANSIGEPQASGPQARAARLAVQEIDALARKTVDVGKVTGLAVVVVHGDRVLLERGYGVVEAGRNEPVDADTVFRIASLSKTMAATLAGLLVRDGALRWDSRIADQLPEFKLRDLQAARQLTVRDILSHRVGLPYHALDRDLEADQPYPLLVARLEQTPITCTPGDCYAYQNIAFSLIGDMVFAASGRFYSFETERRLFHPLGMYTATFGRDALEASARWARPHVRRGGRWVAVRPKETYYRIPPAAGVNASVRDLGQWLIAQLGHRPEVLDHELLRDLHAPLVETRGELRSRGWRGERVKAAHYATGWRVFDYAGQRLLFHAGAVQGYRASMGFLADRDFGVAVLWNCESALPGGLLAATLDRYLGLADRDWTGLEQAPSGRGRR